MASRVGTPINVTFGVEFSVPAGANAFKASGIWYDGAAEDITGISGIQIAVDSLTSVASSSSMGAYSVHGRVFASGPDTWLISKSGFFSEGPTCQVQFYNVADPTNFVREQHVVGDTSGVITRSVASTTADLVDAWVMSDGGGTVTGAIAGYTAAGSQQTTNADHSLVFRANSPGASSTSITGPNNSFPALVIASIFDASSSTTHATSGVLVGQGASIAGAAARTRAHPSSGVLVGPGAAITGSAARTRAHPSSGVLVGPGATVVGSAARTRVHPASGVLVGSGSAITGSAERHGAAISHGTSGVLVGAGSSLSGSANRVPNHSTTGVLVGGGARIVGSAARLRAFDSSGVLVGPGSVITGAANRVGAAVTHNTAGVLVGQGSAVDGLARIGSAHPEGHGFVITDTAPRLWWQRKPKALREEEAAEQVEKLVRVVERVARQQVEQESPAPAKERKREVREAIAPMVEQMPGFDWMAVYRAILIELERRKQEAQAQALAAAEIARIRAIEQDEDDALLLLLSL
ncbi:MAG TPA: hypothetical protein VMA55_20200 [Acidovorax sp.]|nr:hypothetical protein [Acidovorax sp.]